MSRLFLQPASQSARSFTASLYAGLVALALIGAQPVWSEDVPAASTSSATTTTVAPPGATSDTTPDIIQLRAFAEKTANYPIDLETVLKLVADQNLSLAQNQVDVEINQALVRQRQAALLPNIEGSYNQSRFEGGTQVFGGETFNVIRTTVQPQVTLAWTVHPGGRQVYEMLAAKRRKTASEFLVKETYQQQMSNAAQEYYRLLSAYLQRDIATKGIAEAEAQLTASEALFRTGKGLKVDVARARATVAQQRRQMTEAETAVVQAEQALLNRLNLDATIHLLPKPAEGKQKQLVPADTTTARLIEQALPEHPALLRSDQELQALGIDYKTIRSDFIPSLTFRSYVNRTGPEWGNTVQSNFRGVSVNANLLENLGLQIPFRLREKRGQIERKVLERQAQVRTIETGITTAFLSGKNYQAAIEASQDELASAEEAYRLATGRYQAGYGTNLDVVTSQTALTTARINAAQAILNYNQAQVQLLEAMGKVTPEALVNGVVPHVSAQP